MSGYERRPNASRGGPALPAPPAKRSWGRRSAPWLAPLLALIIMQSVTITFPIDVQFVEEESGEPLAGLHVTALWLLDSVTLAGSNPADAIRVRDYVTDQQGRIRVERALMLHTPVLPFDLLTRSPDSLPSLIVTDERVYPRAFFNEADRQGEDAPISVFSLQRSSLDEDILRLPTLARRPPANRQQELAVKDTRRMLESEVDNARWWCSKHWFCHDDEVFHGKNAKRQSRPQ